MVNIGDVEADKTIEILRKQRTHYHSTGRAAQSGDQVLMDYRGTIDGNPFEGNAGTDQYVVLGGGQLLADFEKNVLGMTAGEKTFELRFPDDYHGKAVAGKTARFEVTVKDVREPHVPEADAEFAKTLGVADGDVSRMRAEIRPPRARVKRRAGTASGSVRRRCSTRPGGAAQAAAGHGNRSPDAQHASRSGGARSQGRQGAMPGKLSTRKHGAASASD